MKVSHYIKEVKKSKAFKSFMEECPDAYLCSMFFIRDFSGPQSETQVDFYSPARKDVTSFKIEKGVERVLLQKKAMTLTHKKIIPKPLDENVKMDLDALKPALTDEMRNRDMTYEIEKILAVLNVTDDRAVWNCTGFLKGLGLLQAHVEDQSQSILFMEKRSLLDMVKFAGGKGMGMPGMQQPELGQQQPGSGLVNAGENIKVLSPEELAAELKKEKAAAKETEKEGKQDKKNSSEKKNSKQKQTSPSDVELKKEVKK